MKRSFVLVSFIFGLGVLSFAYFNATSRDTQRLLQTNQPNLARVAQFEDIDSESASPDGRLIFSIHTKGEFGSPLGKIEVVPLRQYNEYDVAASPQNLKFMIGSNPKRHVLKLPGVVPLTDKLKKQLFHKDVMTADTYPTQEVFDKLDYTRAHNMFVGHDPRFGENAFPVDSPAACVDRSVRSPDYEDISIMKNKGQGQYICYKLIVFRKITILPNIPAGTSINKKPRRFYRNNRMFQSYLSLALKVKKPDGSILIYPEVVDSHMNQIFKPVFTRSEKPYRSPCTADLSSGPCLRPISGMEGVPASDARLMVWNEGSAVNGPSRPRDYETHIPHHLSPLKNTNRDPESFVNSNGLQLRFSFNHTPWRNTTWFRPVYHDNLTRHYANIPICPQGTVSCTGARRTIKMKDQFKVMAQVHRDASGSRLPSLGQCFYPWFTPGGNNLMCRFDAFGGPEFAKKGCGSYDKCYHDKKNFIVGYDTGFRLKTISGPINGFSEYITVRKNFILHDGTVKICSSPTETGCKRFIKDQFYSSVGGKDNEIPQHGQGVKVPMGLGFTHGFWKSFPSGQPSNAFLARRPYSFQYYILNSTDFINTSVPMYYNDVGLKINTFSPKYTNRFAYTYGEVAFDDYMDKDFLFFHHFEPAVIPVKSAYLGVNSKGQMEFYAYSQDLKKCVKTSQAQLFVMNSQGAVRACRKNGSWYTVFNNRIFDSSSNWKVASHNYYVERENNNNYKYLGRGFLAESVIYSVEGFNGKGVKIINHRGEIKMSNPMEGENASLKEFSYEMAIRGEDSKTTNLNLPSYIGQIAKLDGVFELNLEEGDLTGYVRNASGDNHRFRVPIASFFTEDIANYTHIGLSVKAMEFKTRLDIYLNGNLASRQIIFENRESVFETIQSSTNFIIGPASRASRFKRVWIDEVAFSRKARGEKYFAIAAHKNWSKSTEAADLFPFKIPRGLSRKDLDLPEEMIPVFKRSDAQISRIVDLGKSLFKSPILTSEGTGGGRTGITCNTCHVQSMAFADHNRLAIGVGVGTKNTPTLINRAYGYSQHMEGNGGNLYEQVIHPILNEKEMGGDIPRILRVLNNNSGYNSSFKSAFGLSGTRPIKEEHLRKALTLYVLSIAGENNPPNNDSFLRGQQVFNNKGRCIGCHSGGNMSDEMLHMSLNGLRIKTPTLMGIDKTAPYFHDGRFSSLEEVVDFYNRGGVPESTNLDPELKPLGLSTQEKEDLVYFLKNLRTIVREGKNNLAF